MNSTDKLMNNVKNAVQAMKDAGIACQKLPDEDKQMDAIKKLSEGKMTYAEMRMLAG
jgi:predicted Fe-Mo cluster-binding NifX family protein